MQPDPEPDDAVEQALLSIDEMTAELFEQLTDLRGRLREASARDLAVVLTELREEVRVLLGTSTSTLGPSALVSLEAIESATDRIERVRTRIVDELSTAATAETALRNWTRSTRNDPRTRPDG